MSKTIFDTLCVVEFTPGVSIDLVNHVYKRIQSPKLRPKINDEEENSCCVHDSDNHRYSAQQQMSGKESSQQPQLTRKLSSYQDGAELLCFKQLHTPSQADERLSGAYSEETQVVIQLLMNFGIPRDYWMRRSMCHCLLLDLWLALLSILNFHS